MLALNSLPLALFELRTTVTTFFYCSAPYSSPIIMPSHFFYCLFVSISTPNTYQELVNNTLRVMLLIVSL